MLKFLLQLFFIDKLLILGRKRKEGLKMKSVVICGLKQLEEKMEEFAAPLRKAGVELSLLCSPSETEDKEICLMDGYSRLMRKADTLFIYNETGEMDFYIVCMMDYALDRGIPVYVLKENIEELKGRYFCVKVASTSQELLEKLQD